MLLLMCCCLPRAAPPPQVHGVPVPMKHAMQDHLKLHLSSKEASDEEVLAIYPSAIRRQILRHLYLDLLQRSSLFQVRPNAQRWLLQT